MVRAHPTVPMISNGWLVSLVAMVRRMAANPTEPAVTLPNKKTRSHAQRDRTFVTAAARIRAEGNKAKCSGAHHRTASAVSVGRARVNTPPCAQASIVLHEERRAG